MEWLSHEAVEALFAAVEEFGLSIEEGGANHGNELAEAQYTLAHKTVQHMNIAVARRERNL